MRYTNNLFIFQVSLFQAQIQYEELLLKQTQELNAMKAEKSKLEEQVKLYYLFKKKKKKKNEM